MAGERFLGSERRWERRAMREPISLLTLRKKATYGAGWAQKNKKRMFSKMFQCMLLKTQGEAQNEPIREPILAPKNDLSY